MRIPLLVLLFLLLGLAGCLWPWIPRTLPPTPTPPPRPTPGIPTPTPTPSLPSPPPTPTPTATKVSTTTPPSYDLAAVPPLGWESALIASPFRDARSSVPFLGPDAPLISWSVMNLGPAPMPSPALVDLSLDGVLVERWRIPPLGPGERFSILNWDELLQRVSLMPGSHTLALIIDPTALLAEESRANNTTAVSFLWTGPPSPTPSPEERLYLADLVFFTPPGWNSPVEIVPLQEGQVRVRGAVRNRGRSAAGVRTFVDLEIDGVVVTRWAVPPLLPGQEVMLEWDGLLETLRLRPTQHRAVARADATGLLGEAREDNNTFAFAFTWPLSQDIPQEPRLSPYIFPGLGDALVLSSLQGQFRQGPVVRGQGVWAHWAIVNQGGALPRPFQVMLLLDGSPLAQWTRPPLAPGQVDVLLDQPLPSSAALLPSGTHRVVLLVGLAQGNGEMGPVLLRIERQIEWVDSLPSPPSATLSPEEVRRRFSLVGPLLDTDGSPGQDGVARAQDILAVASAVYASLYGTALEAEAVDILFLRHREWERWVQTVCADQASVLPPAQQASYYTSCLRLQSANGLTTRWRGRLRIALMAQRPPAEVLRDLGHELGHLRQMLVNPQWERAPDSLNLRAVREAQGFLHEVLFLRMLEEHTGLDLTLYPRTPLYSQWAQEALATVHAQQERDEYARGMALLWTAVLSDGNLRRARNDLLVQGRLSVASLRSTFVYFLTLPPEQAEAYARRHLALWESQRPTIENLVLGRLVLGLPPVREGIGAFRSVGLLLP